MRSKKRGPPGTTAYSLVTKRPIGKYDKNGRFLPFELLQIRSNNVTKEGQSKGGRKGKGNPKNSFVNGLAGRSQKTPKNMSRAAVKKKARELLDEIIEKYGDDVVAVTQMLVDKASGKGVDSGMEQIAAFKCLSDLVLGDAKSKANVGGSTHVTNNFLVSSESTASKFLAAHAGRGRELVAVQTGEQGGPNSVPVGLPAGRTERDDDPEGPGGADGVAEVDPRVGGVGPGDDGGADGTAEKKPGAVRSPVLLDARVLRVQGGREPGPDAVQ